MSRITDFNFYMNVIADILIAQASDCKSLASSDFFFGLNPSVGSAGEYAPCGSAIKSAQGLHQ
jgi:hypothetical protein